MIKTQEISDPNSCLNRAADDEPLFVLRANDETAPSVVWNWAAQYLAAKGGRIDEHGDIRGLKPEQLVKYNDALASIESMQAWKAAQPQ